MKLFRVARGTACSVLVLVSLAACGGGSESATDTGATTAEAPAAAAGGGGGAGGGAGMPGAPGASGLVAAVTGSTAQLQGDDGQVAVSWSGSTTFTEQVAGTLADVAVGSCVMVMSDSETADGEPVAASSVRITEAEGGECAGGFGGPGGERPEGMPTDLPSDMPTDLPTDLPQGGAGGFGGGAFGAVTAVTDGGFTVESADSAVEVTVAAATSYTTTATATAKAVEVGRCATAVGEADDTGAVTATRISLSDAVDGVCQMAGRGFGGAPGTGDAS